MLEAREYNSSVLSFSFTLNCLSLHASSDNLDDKCQFVGIMSTKISPVKMSVFSCLFYFELFLVSNVKYLSSVKHMNNNTDTLDMMLL